MWYVTVRTWYPVLVNPTAQLTLFRSTLFHTMSFEPLQVLALGELGRGSTRTGVNYLAQSYTPGLELLAWTDGKSVRLVPARLQCLDGTARRAASRARQPDTGLALDHAHELRLEDADAMHHLAWARQAHDGRGFLSCAGARALQVWEVTVVAAPSFEIRAALLSSISVSNEDNPASGQGQGQRSSVGRPQPHPIRGLSWCPFAAQVPLLAVARASDVRLFKLVHAHTAPTPTSPTAAATATATATAAARAPSRSTTAATAASRATSASASSAARWRTAARRARG